MGKVRRARQKAHNVAVKGKTGDGTSVKQDETVEMDQDRVLPVFEVPQTQCNIFDGLDLSKYNLKAQLPEFDTQSAITSKSLKELKLKKKERQKLRHDLWLKKLSAIDSAKKDAKEKKKKEQTAVVGDIGALGDALPTLELLLKTSTKPVQSELNKPKGIQKEKKRKKQMMDDISVFQQVIKHPAFKENPTTTIAEHLHNRQKQENMEP
ncbi:uncharacterized protein LOC123538398 [Mercenaria mercenaria]|uniref:uncharacterized protein LOC123538398 n=1 Tax=Mercenaria mercenaria TaxID=6596 RepID=UPI00234F45E4|nr:uncharacterized protein LOC123538398 [Mercenaria mercenaria]XP_045178413.2 uncharacterized protein LOC123538398 [Mercenaria mercenaria]